MKRISQKKGGGGKKSNQEYGKLSIQQIIIECLCARHFLGATNVSVDLGS